MDVHLLTTYSRPEEKSTPPGKCTLRLEGLWQENNSRSCCCHKPPVLTDLGSEKRR